MPKDYLELTVHLLSADTLRAMRKECLAALNKGEAMQPKKLFTNPPEPLVSEREMAVIIDEIELALHQRNEPLA